jgi:hypothetical protein
MIQPVEMTKTFPMELHDGTVSTTTDVWNMLVASRDGDLDRVSFRRRVNSDVRHARNE